MSDGPGGGTWITFLGGRASSLRVRRVELSVVAGPDRGKRAEFESERITLGARRADFEVTDGKVSGLHCEIRLDARGYRLVDSESTNGTFVGGLRVNDVYIEPETTIAIGNTRVMFRPLDASVEVPLAERDRFGDLVGRSPKMRELFARMEKLASSDATVLIRGETGAGKDLVAESLHQASPRKERAFVVVDCSAIPPHLIESELFGHERGSFMGTQASYAGAFERAHGGTLFLDQIVELPIELQPKLLRWLETREVRRIGGTVAKHVDVRVLTASSRDLMVEVNRGRFREDLLYRLLVTTLDVPPLREHKEDIPLLVETLLTQLPGGDTATIAPQTMQMLEKHDWPGNVRELRNVLERAISIAEPPTALRNRPPTANRTRSSVLSALEADDGMHINYTVDIAVPFKDAKHELVEVFERAYVTRLLMEHKGNLSAAARAAGIDRMSIHKLIARLGLQEPAES
ncbi:MAG: sigma 54-dependent Fis family transcriptional regulator [Myxococcales bacterium]|nr:sigma 54-dependent Fis family transcriptional regulator [Myxococcales bacterium]